MSFIPKHLKIQPKCQTYSNDNHQAWKSPNPSGKVEKRQSDGVINGALTQKKESATSSGTHSIGVRRA
jgi:hypothetical protein